MSTLLTQGQPRVIIENEFVTLWYHPDGKIVHHKIHKVGITSAAFREALTTGAEFFERNGACKWLSDNRFNGALHPDDSSWAVNEWSKRVIKAGWELWAIVMPEPVLGKLAMKRFINMYSDLGVVVETFPDPTPALAWLKNHKS
jgi:hypothetical protein